MNITLPNISQANIIKKLWHVSPLMSTLVTQNFRNTGQVTQSMHNGTMRFYYGMNFKSITELLTVITKTVI